MSRNRSAIVATGYGLAALGVAAAAGMGLLRAQVAVARQVIGTADQGTGLDDSGRYGAGVGEPYRLLVLGDSTAAGVGAGSAGHTLAATVATGVAALTGRPVQLRNVARTGATSPQLIAQVERGLSLLPEAQVALIVIGGNDVTHRLDQAAAVRALAEAVARLRGAGVEVVVGTCPDLGTIRPIPQPLRTLVQHWSRALAAAQTVAVVEAGGRTVSLGDLVGPQFREQPAELFSADRFHPSAAGYARAAAAVLPSVCDALGLITPDTGRAPDERRGEHLEPLPDAARRAAHDPGSEVSGAGTATGRWGELAHWAKLLRRQRLGAPGADVTSTPT